MGYQDNHEQDLRQIHECRRKIDLRLLRPVMAIDMQLSRVVSTNTGMWRNTLSIDALAQISNVVTPSDLVTFTSERITNTDKAKAISALRPLSTYNVAILFCIAQSSRDIVQYECT